MRRHVLLAALLLPGLCAGQGEAPTPAASPIAPKTLQLAAALSDWSVTPSQSAQLAITWPQFLHEVMEANLDFAAQRYNVDLAQADLAAAKLLPNPTLSLGATRDLTYHNRYATGTDGEPARLRQVEDRSIGLDQTIEWPGKRHWRIKMADQTLRAAAASLEDFLRNLKLDAASAWADALSAQRAVERLRASAAFLHQLTETQAIRFHAGDIGESDYTQARLEELQFRNDLSKAEDEAEADRFALSTFLGRERGRTDFTIDGELAQPPHGFDLDGTIEDTLKTRPDLIALRHTRDAAQSGVSLAKASIVPDLDLGVTYTYDSGVAANHPVDPTPADHQLGLTLGIPLPLFDHGQTGIAHAHAAADQAQAQLAAAELKAEVGIRTAWAQYRSAQARAESFRGDIVKSADKLLDARRYAYQRGANSLLELIAAQRDDNDIHADADQADAEAAKALIELERASGMPQNVHF